MSRYVLVDKAPKELDKDCIVIDKPSFIEEIRQCVKKKPRTGTMTTNYLREIISTIGLKYAKEGFNPLTDVVVAPYKGIPCETEEKIHDIVVKAFAKDYPEIFDDFVDAKLKSRPHGTKLIYFLGDHLHTSMFHLNGIDSIKLKDVDVYLGKKTKKTIGKPFASKKQEEN